MLYIAILFAVLCAYVAVTLFLCSRPDCRKSKTWARNLAAALQAANPDETWSIRRVRKGLSYQWVPERTKGGGK